MPAKAWPLWLYTVALTIAYPVVCDIYFSELGRSGFLPPDADSIGIVIIGNLIATVIISPFLFLLTWFCLRKYNPQSHLFDWGKQRPLRSFISSAAFGFAALGLFIVSIIDFDLADAWYDNMLMAYFALWIPWFLWMRAAVVGQL